MAWLCALGILACGTGNESPAKPPYPRPTLETGGRVAVTVGPVAITTAELEKRLKSENAIVQAQLRDEKQLRKYVETQARSELLSQEAWSRGLYDDPSVLAELKRIMAQRVLKDAMQALAGSVDITETELFAAYESRKDEYLKPETIRLSQIVLPWTSEPEKNKAKRRLETLKGEITRAEKKNVATAFAETAKKESADEATKNAGGDLQFVTLEALTARFGSGTAQQIFETLPMGEMSVVESPDSVVLLKKTGRRRGLEKTLEMVKPQLRAQLLGEKRTKALDEFIRSLEATHSVSIDDGTITELAEKLNGSTGTKGDAGP